MMTREAIEAFLKAAGWQRTQEDEWQKDIPFKLVGRTGITEARPMRVKMNKLSMRIDLMRAAGTGFFRIGGAPFSVIKLREADGAMLVASYVFEPAGRAARI